jgi:hypothetical protein
MKKAISWLRTFSFPGEKLQKVLNALKNGCYRGGSIRFVFVVILVLFCGSLAPARAQSTHSSSGDASESASHGSSANPDAVAINDGSLPPKVRPPLICTRSGGNGAPVESALAPATGTSRLLLSLADNIIWQPRDGKVRFTITANGSDSPSTLNNIEVAVCFGWPNLVYASADTNLTPKLYRSSYLRTIDRTDSTITYETNLPDELWGKDNAKFAPTLWDFWADFIRQWVGQPVHVYDGWGLVPTIHMRVVARSQGATDVPNDPNALDVVLPVGISSHLSALAGMLGSVFLAWWILLRWARSRGVRGNCFLAIIANRNGYASLSQFQILLWTVVIGAGLTYVMALSGDLIDVPAQTLALLGISGFSALTAAYAGNSPSQKKELAPSTNPSNPVPETVGVIREPAAVSVGPNTAALFWLAPEGGLPPSSYVVTLVSPVTTSPPQITMRGPANQFAQISGLAANTPYRFSIMAKNALLSLTSDPVEIAFQTTSGARGTPPAVSLAVRLDIGQNAPHLTWAHVGDVDGYILQYRRSGAPEWCTQSIIAKSVDGVVNNSGYLDAVLSPVTPYEFRTAGLRDGDLSPWSNIVAVKTAKRVPKWSDLVIWDGNAEIDITRLQMLVFTVLAAAFVALKIGDEGAIPTIPDGIILLMGLTNGVYVGGKFVPGQK